MNKETIKEIITVACDKSIYNTNNELIKSSDNPLKYTIFNNKGSYIAFDSIPFKFNKIEIIEFNKIICFKVIFQDYVVNIIDNLEFNDLEIGL